MFWVSTWSFQSDGGAVKTSQMLGAKLFALKFAQSLPLHYRNILRNAKGKDKTVQGQTECFRW